MSQLPFGNSFLTPPGVSSLLQTIENQFLLDPALTKRLPAWISGSSVDSGNTAFTHMLRAGLALGGPVDAADYAAAAQTYAYRLQQWDPTATNGSQYFFGFLEYPVYLLDSLGTARDAYCPVVVEGSVMGSQLIVPGNTSLGLSGNLYEELLQQMFPRFTVDNKVNLRAGNTLNLPPVILATLTGSTTAAATLLAAHAGREYQNTGDTGSRTINLPHPIPGMRFSFRRITAQAMVVTPVSGDTIVGLGNVAAATLTLASAGAYVTLVGSSSSTWTQTNGGGTLTLA